MTEADIEEVAVYTAATAPSEELFLNSIIFPVRVITLLLNPSATNHVFLIFIQTRLFSF